jgi:hypothetical protein
MAGIEQPFDTAQPLDLDTDRQLPVSPVPPRLAPATDDESVPINGNTADSTQGSPIEEVTFPRNIPPHLAKMPDHSFQLLQLWEGSVLSADKDGFQAILQDKTDPKHSDEKVVLSWDIIDPSDRRLVQPGAVFYWSIGYSESRTKQRVTESKIRFRRLPRLTNREIKQAEERAAELVSKFARS